MGLYTCICVYLYTCIPVLVYLYTCITAVSEPRKWFPRPSWSPLGALLKPSWGRLGAPLAPVGCQLLPAVVSVAAAPPKADFGRLPENAKKASKTEEYSKFGDFLRCQ